MHHATLNAIGLISSSSQRFKRLYPSLDSNRGMAARSILITSSIILIAIIAGMTWFLAGSKDPLPLDQAAPLNSYQDDKPVPAQVTALSSAIKDGGYSRQSRNEEVWQAIQDMFRVERADYSGDPKQKERGIAKENFRRIEQQLQSLRDQGLEGDALYGEAETQLAEAHGQGILKMLEGYRLLEQELAKNDLEAMTPEERFEHTKNLRQYAFGEEMADNLFFEKEAFASYKLGEKKIMEDTSLSPEAKQEELAARGKSLQVELAARGAYVSFAKNRKDELESKLQARYGDSVETMTEEERKAAIWEMYSEEMPPEILDRVRSILTTQAEKNEALKTYQQERKAVLEDTDLTFEEKQELLADLAERLGTAP